MARYRQGRASAAVIVMEVAAAVEYWVRANLPTAWAESAVKSRRWVQALADRCGKPFADWVRNPEAWARAFGGAYNRLKHEPTYEPELMELADLAESARYLLGAAILDRAARSRAPTRAIFRHHRLNSLGVRLRIGIRSQGRVAPVDGPPPPRIAVGFLILTACLSAGSMYRSVGIDAQLSPERLGGPGVPTAERQLAAREGTVPESAWSSIVPTLVSHRRVR